MPRLARLVTPLLIVVLCALVVWWGLRLMPGAPIAIPPVADADGSGDGGRVDAIVASARLFGSRRPGVLSDNVRALGVVADQAGRGSVIVSVDGQSPKVYRVGDTLDGRLVSAIRSDEIELEANGARQVFRLPPARPSAAGLTIIGDAAASTSGTPYVPEVRYQPTPPASVPLYQRNGPRQPGPGEAPPPDDPPMNRRSPQATGIAPPPPAGSNR